jgi:outer membrane receptor protein involved in Fe transport
MHRLPKRQSLRFSYGTAFRAPTLLDAYENLPIPIGPGMEIHALGNTHLSPEAVTSYEAGYRKEFDKGFVGLNVFYNRATQLINTVPSGLFPSPPAPPNTPSGLITANTNGATIAGFEVESELTLGKRLHLLCNYAYQALSDPGDVSSGFLTPKHKINLALRGNLSPRLEAFLGAHFVGAATEKTYGIAGTTPAYTRVDARIAYRFASRHRPWTVALSATNLFDDRHLEFPVTTPPGSPMEVTPQRRTLYLSLTGQF